MHLLVMGASHCVPDIWLWQPADRSSRRGAHALRQQAPHAKTTAADDRVQAAIPGGHKRSLVRIAFSLSLYDSRGAARLALLALSRLEEIQRRSHHWQGQPVDVLFF